MTIDLLNRAGETLYGSRWQTDLSRHLNVGARRVRAWTSGEEPVPPGVWADIYRLLETQSIDIKDLKSELRRSHVPIRSRSDR